MLVELWTFTLDDCVQLHVSLSLSFIYDFALIALNVYTDTHAHILHPQTVPSYWMKERGKKTTARVRSVKSVRILTLSCQVLAALIKHGVPCNFDLKIIDQLHKHNRNNDNGGNKIIHYHQHHHHHRRRRRHPNKNWAEIIKWSLQKEKLYKFVFVFLLLLLCAHQRDRADNKEKCWGAVSGGN